MIPRWSGRPLRELMPTLEREIGDAPTVSAARELPSGARVALLRHEGHRRLIIWRVGAPKSDDWQVRWEKECATFLRHFGCEHWIRTRVDARVEQCAVFDEPAAVRT